MTKDNKKAHNKMEYCTEWIEQQDDCRVPEQTAFILNYCLLHAFQNILISKNFSNF